MDQELRGYIIVGGHQTYYKGHHKNGWAFTSKLTEVFLFNTKGEADILADQMNEIIKSSSHHKEGDNLPFVSLVL